MKCLGCGEDIPAGEEYAEISSENQCHKKVECLSQTYGLSDPFFYRHVVPSCKGCSRDIEEADSIILFTADLDDEGFEFYCHANPDCLAEALGAQLVVWEEELQCSSTAEVGMIAMGSRELEEDSSSSCSQRPQNP